MIRYTFEFDCDVVSDLEHTPENIEKLRNAVLDTMEDLPLVNSASTERIGDIVSVAAR